MSEHTELLRNLAKEAAQVNAEQAVQYKAGRKKQNPILFNSPCVSIQILLLQRKPHGLQNI